MTRQTSVAILAFLAMVGTNATAAIRKGAEYNDSYPTRYLVEERLQPSDDVVPGKWHPHLEKCRAYAEANGLPLIAVWSNGDKCGHCKMFENNALSDVFEAWMATSGIVYYFGYYEDSNSSDATVRKKGGMGGEWGYWCGGKSTDKALPFVRIYWKDSSGTLRVDYDTNGDTMDGYNGRGSDNTYNVGGQAMIDYLMNSTNGKLKDYTPVPAYAGGEFAVHADQTVGLQAELGKTTTVYVPFSRESASAQKKAYTNKLRITYPDNAATEKYKNIEWAVGASSATVAVDVSSYLTGVEAGERIALRLLDENDKQLEKRYITYVSPVGNSPKNPYWGNERTAETLEFGEWTMNLDAVKGKVKAFNAKKSAGRAYAMVLVGGALWCPDCVMADHWLFDYEANGVNQFEKWAKANNIALGVVDIPNYTAAGATSGSCLLTYDLNTASSNYASGRGSFPQDDSELIQSGAQYMSRHGITPDEAAAAMKTNKKLVQRDVTAGGYRRPEATGNTYRPGVPVLLLLRNEGDDWSVAGRFDTFSSNAPRSYSANYLTRLEELLAQVDEAAEEDNDDWRTTMERIAKRGVAEGRTLSHSDLKDVYIIEPDAVGQMLDFKLTGKSSGEVTLSVISSVNDKLVLASATGSPVSGTVSVTCKIPSDKCFLVVSTDREDAAQAGSSVIDYSLSSDNVLVATEATQYETVADGNPVVTISTEAGKTYRISNVDESRLGGYFTKAASDGFYVASTTGSAKVYLKNSTVEGGNVVYKTDYQVWKTGVIGFDRGVATTKEIESDFDYTLKVTRTGGVSGVAKASISLDAGEALDDGSVFVWSDEGTVFEWADGEDDVKTVSVKIRANTFADGEQRLTFRLTTVEGESDAGVDEVLGVLTLVIKDDDAATAGTLAICGTEPGFSKQMTTVAAAGSKVKIKVSREDGADGEVTAVLKTSAGLFSNDKDTFELGWASRSNDVKTVTLTLPGKEAGVASLQVTLSSTSGAKVDNARKYLAVKTSECRAAFEAESTAVELSAVRYVPFSTELYVNESTLGEGTIAVRKFSGSLAPGLSWIYGNDKKTVYVSGTPTQAGSWTVVYQVTEDGAAGLTASLTVDVSELAVSEDDEVEPINASVGETRTVKDIIVMDSEKFVGLLTVTVPQSGRLSAKMRLAAGGYVSFLSGGWDRLEGRDLVAELYDIDGGAETVSVRAAADGGLTVATTLGDTCVVPAVQWSSATPASAWQGYYTVSMPQTSVVDVDGFKADPLTSGAGYATLKMSATSAVSGKMAYAGVLPNGRAFSGIGVLTPDVDSWNSDRGAYDYAFLPVISETDGDRFFGVFKVLTGGAHLPCRSVFATPSFTWVRDGDREELVRTTAMDAFGSGYDGDDDIAQACSDTFQEELDLLKFYALTDELYDHLGFTRGAALPWDTTYTSVKVWSASGATKIRIRPYEAEAKSKNGLVFSYNRASGIVSGTLRIDFENGSSANALFRGVVMPRWGASCAMCSFGSDLTLRPFISGSVWFTDTYEYTTAKGRPATKDVKRGCSFSVGVNPGE